MQIMKPYLHCINLVFFCQRLHLCLMAFVKEYSSICN